jgi:U1 small nuclear ribonucleoprotein
VKIVSDKEGKPKGYAFLEFERESTLKLAYKEAEGLKLNGRKLLVDVERGRTVKDWKPKKLGGGLGKKRVGGPPKASRLPDRMYTSSFRGGRGGGAPRDGPRGGGSFRGGRDDFRGGRDQDRRGPPRGGLGFQRDSDRGDGGRGDSGRGGRDGGRMERDDRRGGGFNDRKDDRRDDRRDDRSRWGSDRGGGGRDR